MIEQHRFYIGKPTVDFHYRGLPTKTQHTDQSLTANYVRLGAKLAGFSSSSLVPMPT